MGRQKPFLYVVVRTHRADVRYEVVPAGDDKCDRCIVVFGPAAESVCWQHVAQLEGPPVRKAG